MIGLAKRISHTKEVVDAKAAGWKFTTDGATVSIVPPEGMPKEEADKARRPYRGKKPLRVYCLIVGVKRNER